MTGFSSFNNTTCKSSSSQAVKHASRGERVEKIAEIAGVNNAEVDNDGVINSEFKL